MYYDCTIEPKPDCVWPWCLAAARAQVYSILDEYILAGEIQETSKREILERIRDMERYEKVSEKS